MRNRIGGRVRGLATPAIHVSRPGGRRWASKRGRDDHKAVLPPSGHHRGWGATTCTLKRRVSLSLSLKRTTPMGPKLNGCSVQPARKSIRDLLGQRGIQYRFAAPFCERRHRGLHAAASMSRPARASTPRALSSGSPACRSPGRPANAPSMDVRMHTGIGRLGRGSPWHPTSPKYPCSAHAPTPRSQRSDPLREGISNHDADERCIDGPDSDARN